MLQARILANAAFAIFAVATFCAAAEKTSVSLEGEVLDLHCFMLHPDSGQGPDHAKCATSCINRGLSPGFLADGQVYVLLGPGHDSAAEMVAEHAGKPVTLVGSLVEHHGVKAIQVESVAADGKPAAATKPAAHDHSDPNHSHDGHGH